MRKEFSICSNKVKYSHKETQNLVTNEFYGLLEQKTSKDKTKLA